MFGINFSRGGKAKDSLAPQFEKGAKIQNRHSVDTPPPGSEYRNKETGSVNPNLGTGVDVERELGSVKRVQLEIATYLRKYVAAEIEKDVVATLAASGETAPDQQRVADLVETEIQRRSLARARESLEEQRRIVSRAAIITTNRLGDDIDL